MLKNKKVIIFDLDGTLLDSMGIWNSIDEELIKRIGNGEIDDIDVGLQRNTKLREYSQSSDNYLEYCNFLKEKYHSKMTKEDIKKLRYEIAENYLREKVDYKPNAEKVLKYLKEKGYILVVATTTNDSTIEIYKKYNQNIINKITIDQDKNIDIYYKVVFKITNKFFT